MRNVAMILNAIFVGSVIHAAEPDSKSVEFNRDIRPILSDRCFACHGPDANHRKAELRLDTADGAKADLGGRSAVVPGKPDESELFLRISSTDPHERMPPEKAGKPLTAAEIDLFKRWIAQGGAYQAHWSFIPPKRPPVPDVTNKTWPRNEIDRFILARLEQEGISPSPAADAVTLVRRVSFDLGGLPPSAAEVDAFVNNDSVESYNRLVERLLESPHYGERMAMYWLDLVRYADTVGYHGDQEHYISPYRDYVINAFNDNMRFDQFTVEQLAGDLLPDATVDQQIASGYNRLLQTSHEGGFQPKEYQHKYDADRVRNLGSVWMGATLGCVECHSHKFDPYTHREYYSLVAVFADIDDTFKGVDSNPTKREPELDVLSPIDRDRIEKLETRAAAIEKQLESPKSGSPDDIRDAAELAKQRDALRAEIEALKKQTRRTMITNSVSPRTIRVLARGDWQDETGEIVEPNVPRFLKPLDSPGRRITRLDLAKWLVSAEHPQTARVFVNRLWYLFFGNGLCNSLEDTGSQGEWPTHPALLDWLAVEFAESGWDVKHMVRLMVTSSAYRQSSRERDELRERDPDNRLYARQSAVRLPAEMIRDNVLAVSGLLVDRLGGPSGHPYQPAKYYQFLNFPKREYKADEDENQYRRGVYTHWQRTYLHPMLKAFDAPSREECTARRPISNTPLSALVLLNDPSFVEAARAFAVRMIREGGATDEDRLRWAWKTALSRPAEAQEIAALLRLLETERTAHHADETSAEKLLSVGLAKTPAEVAPGELAAWTAAARAIFNLHEAITRY
jgi:hypothetical protein